MSSLYRLRKPNPQFPDQENKVIEITLNYRKGGVSWVDSTKNIVAGYYINVVPATITQKDGFEMRETEAFTGYNRTIIACERRSQKKVDEAIAWINNNLTEILKPFYAKS